MHRPHTDTVNWDSAHIVIVCHLKATISPTQVNEFVSFFKAQTKVISSVGSGTDKK